MIQVSSPCGKSVELLRLCMARPNNLVLEPEAHVVNLICHCQSLTNFRCCSSHCGWINLWRNLDVLQKVNDLAPFTLTVSPTRVRCFLVFIWLSMTNCVFMHMCSWHLTWDMSRLRHHLCHCQFCAHFFRKGPATPVRRFVNDWRWLSLTFFCSCHHGTCEAVSSQSTSCAGSWCRLFAAGYWLPGSVNWFWLS